MSVARITPNFTWAEAECHDGAEVPLELQPNVRRVANLLEKIRARHGGPLIAVSWYRTPWYNKQIGGAPASRHMVGDAVDFRPTDLDDLPRLRAQVEDMIRDGEVTELGGLGVYRSWLHVDTRPRKADGSIARWFGKGVGSET